MNINWALKQAIANKFGSQVVAANQMGIRESRLSYIICGHAQPSKTEIETLINALGRDVVENALKGRRHESSRN